MDENKNMQLFMGLCTSLVTQAWMQLGKIKNPMTDKIETDINGASLTIDMIVMLKEKTSNTLPTSYNESCFDKPSSIVIISEISSFLLINIFL